MKKSNTKLIALLAALAPLLLLCTFCTTASAIACTGCVDLDEINFEHTIVRFPYALVKFDIAFPFGDKHEAFAELSRAAHKVSHGELLVATVGIKDYGELENKVLGDRYAVNEKNFPGIILFKGRTDRYIKFPAHLDVTANNLKDFVSKNTELYIGCDGCVKELNALIKDYANQPDEKQLEVISEAELLLKKYEGKQMLDNITAAKTYLTYMRKINEQGYSFVEEETKRLQRLRAGKVHDTQKLQLQHKLNVLDKFRVFKLTKVSAATTAEEQEETNQETAEAYNAEL